MGVNCTEPSRPPKERNMASRLVSLPYAQLPSGKPGFLGDEWLLEAISVVEILK